MKFLRLILLFVAASICYIAVVFWSEHADPTRVTPLFRIEMFAVVFSGVSSTWSWIEITKRIHARARRPFFLWTALLGLLSLVLFLYLLFGDHNPTPHLLAICGIFAVFAIHNISVVVTLPRARQPGAKCDHVEDIIDAQQWLLTENLPSACAYLLLAVVIASLQKVGVKDTWFGFPSGTNSAIVFAALVSGAAAFHLLISTGTFFAHAHFTYRPQAALADYLTVARKDCEEWKKVHDEEWEKLRKRKSEVWWVVILIALVLLAGLSIAFDFLPSVWRWCGEHLDSWLKP